MRATAARARARKSTAVFMRGIRMSMMVSAPLSHKRKMVVSVPLRHNRKINDVRPPNVSV